MEINMKARVARKIVKNQENEKKLNYSKHQINQAEVIVERSQRIAAKKKA